MRGWCFFMRSKHLRNKCSDYLCSAIGAGTAQLLLPSLLIPAMHLPATFSGLCFTSAWILCCAHRAVRVPQQGETVPPEHKAAVQLAALIVAADAAALATVTGAPGGFAPADGLLDAGDVLAAAERAGDWLCSPVLWQVSCFPSHAAH